MVEWENYLCCITVTCNLIYKYWQSGKHGKGTIRRVRAKWLWGVHSQQEDQEAACDIIMESMSFRDREKRNLCHCLRSIKKPKGCDAEILL